MRVCPLGAHSDHQLGVVVGFALDKGIQVIFAPRFDAEIHVRSHAYEGDVVFKLDALDEMPRGTWRDYCVGAARILRYAYSVNNGMDALILNDLPSGGLGSSAAVGVAYLMALGVVNGVSIPSAALIELDRRIENDYLGLQNGVIDQSVCLLGEADRLIRLDCRDRSYGLIEPRSPVADMRIAVAYSGVAKPLTHTDFNRRVEDCRAAANELLTLAGTKVENPVLRDVPFDVYARHEHALVTPLRNRARHFFTEQERVMQSTEAWTEGNLERFGDLMRRSGESSIKNYEVGCEEIVDLFEIMNETPGMYGARFGGGGFRGSCFGICSAGNVDRIQEMVLEAYLRRHPKMQGIARVYFCRPGSGARRP